MYWMINPATGDYLMENGAPVLTDSPVVPAYYRAKIPRKMWMYAPDENYGNDAASLQKNVSGAARDMTNAALQPLVTEGVAQSVTVQNDTTVQTNRNNDALQAIILDAQGQPQVLPLPSIGA